MSNLGSVLAIANGLRVSAWHKRLVSINTIRRAHLQANTRGGIAGALGRAASTLGRGSLILVLTAASLLSSAAFAAPVGAIGPAPTLKPVSGEDPPITFNFNIGGNIGSGSLMSTNEGGGNFLATSGTLTMTTPTLGGANSTYCLVPAGAASVSTSPLGAFLYDNVVAPGANPAFPTIYGLLFSNTLQACGQGFSGSDEINIWATNAPPGTPGHYSFYDYSVAAGYVAYDTPAASNDSFNASTVTTTYSYTGRAFNRFECSTSPTTDCPNPGTGNPYGASNSVTASLQLAAPLCAPGSCSSVPINVLCSPNFVAMTLNDGLNTVSVTSCNAGGTAWVTTDTNGNINAWYLDATGGGGEDIHTLYDPVGAIANAHACNGCYPNGAQNNEQDYGQFSLPSSSQYAPLLVYGYNLGAHGSFTPAYSGGTTTAGNCSNGQSCTLVPGNTFTIKGPNAAAIPRGAILTEQECVVPADPRGANCGAVNGHLPRSLNVSDLPQCKGFGNEVIPDYMCGASGSSGTGFALILGNAEQIDTFNGTYGDSELDVEKVPDLKGAATNPTCPKQLLLPGVPSALAAVATRGGSLVEEQTPEQTFDGRPLLIEMTSSCDPPKSNHGPGLTLEGIGFKLRTKDPTARGGLTDAQSLLALANYKYLNLDVVMLLTKFPTNTPTRKNLQSCINKSQTLLNSGPSHYNCAAEQVYRCEQIVEATDFNQFGPTKGPFLRLPDPYGDVVRRLGNLFYTIDTRINGKYPNIDWPLPESAGHPGGDPYPGACP
jgi:hypothetical protein